MKSVDASPNAPPPLTTSTSDACIAAQLAEKDQPMSSLDIAEPNTGEQPTAPRTVVADATKSLSSLPEETERPEEMDLKKTDAAMDTRASSNSENIDEEVLAGCPLAPNYPPAIHPTVESPTLSKETVGNPGDMNPGAGVDMEVGVVEKETIPDEDAEEADDDEDMSSEASDGVDLAQELEDALNDKFDFKGSYYHAQTLPQAPNPCLYISGLGLVGLPLSERDAKSIISFASLAPFGHGERTVIDKDVRDTWEIEPEKFAFANSAWKPYVEGIVNTAVWNALGVAPSATPPKLELYKLLLYERGSHFLAHQDTQKAEGMFATVIILLPSAFTGGEVHLTHSSSANIIDLAPNSLTSTSVLAWYTDVRHEVKPITSGYRLALAYNLIHIPSPGSTLPSLPDMKEPVEHLRHVLRKWRKGRYEDGPDPNLIAYVLNHEYSPVNLREGIRGLKGVDAHRMAFLRPMAEEEGFTVGFANLKHYISGSAEDSGGCYYRRGRYSDWEDRESTPGMGDIEETTTTISEIVDLDGGVLVGDFAEITLGEGCLIPKEPFDGAAPDETEYEGYMGNGAGQLEHWYNRTVLVLVHKDNMDDIYYSQGGLQYALKRLQQSMSLPPTKEDRKWAGRVLSHLSKWDKNTVSLMMAYALQWRDSDMWTGSIKSSQCNLDLTFIKELSEAWKVFGFETIRTSLETILARSQQLKERLDLITGIPKYASPEEKDAVHAWCHNESRKVLESYAAPKAEDVPVIMAALRRKGVKEIGAVMMPNLLKKQGTYSFLVAFVKALHGQHRTLLQNQTTTSTSPLPSTSAISPGQSHVPAESAPSFTQAGLPDQVAASTAGDDPKATAGPSKMDPDHVHDLLKQCLRGAVTQWGNVTVPSDYYYGYGSQNTSRAAHTNKVDRIIELVQECITTDCLDTCKDLIINILKSPEQSTAKFQQIYTPLIPRLVQLLKQKNRDVSTPPFVDFFQVVIGTYLRDILGKKSKDTVPRLRRVGCGLGCADCNALDVFMLNPRSTTESFRIVQKRRLHLERQLGTARDLCTYQYISGRPQGVQVTKKPEVVHASQWETKQQEARLFLRSFGTEEDLKRLMGARYVDVQNAVNGVQQFGALKTIPDGATAPGRSIVPPSVENRTPTTAPASAQSNAPRATIVPAVPAAGPSLSSNSLAAEPAMLAGKKRKSGPLILGPVIDLTGEDSA